MVIIPRELTFLNRTQGVKGCGPQLAHALARCGFGDELLRAFERRQREDIQLFLISWRNRINSELRTNSRGMLPRKAPSVVLPSDFPDLQVLKYYAEPLTSGTRGVSGGPIRDNSDLSLPRVAGFCEEHFDEWGHRSMIIKRFRDLLWESALMRVMRRAALEADLQEKNQRLAAGRTDLAIRGPLTPSVEQGIGTPAALVNRYLNPAMVDRIAEAFVNRGPQVGPTASTPNPPDAHPLVIKIVGTRRHVSTDHMLEYRLEIDPHQFVDLTNSGITGSRPDPPLSNRQVDEEVDNILEPSQSAPKTPKKAPPDRYSIMRVWLAASIVRQVHPKLVKDFEDAEAAKNAPKATPSPRTRKGKEKATEAIPDHDEEVPVVRPPPAKSATTDAPAPRTRKGKERARDVEIEDGDERRVVPPPAPRPLPQTAPPSAPAPRTRKGKERARDVDLEDHDERRAAPPPRPPAPRSLPQTAPPPPPPVLPVASQQVRRSVEPIRAPLPLPQPSQLPPVKIFHPPLVQAFHPPPVQTFHPPPVQIFQLPPVQIPQPPPVIITQDHPTQLFPQQPVPIPRRKARPEIPIDSESSLPQRACGFIFTFPNPDNPDHILTEEEEEEEEDALEAVEYQRRHVPHTPPITQVASGSSRFQDIFNQVLAVAATAPVPEAGPSQPLSTRYLDPLPQVVSDTPPTPRLSQPKPRPLPRPLATAVPPPPSWPTVASTSTSNPPLSNPAPAAREWVDPGEDEDAPTNQFDAMIDDLLGVGNNRGKGKRKQGPGRGRGRGRGRSGASGSQRPTPAKRQRTVDAQDVPAPAAALNVTPPPSLPLPVPNPVPAPTSTPTQRVPAPFPNLPPLNNPPPLPSLATTPPPRVNPRKRPIPVDASITSVHSDDEYPPVAPPLRRRPLQISGSIISIHSDDDDGPGTSNLATTTAAASTAVASSSSHVEPAMQGAMKRSPSAGVHLNVPDTFQLRSGLLQDVDDVIDLT